MLINKLLLFAGKKSSLQTCNYAKGRNQRWNNATDSFGKGFDVLKDHVLNRLMTGRCPPLHHCSYGRSSTRFFSKIASIFKKVLHLKHLNRHLECTDVSFNSENGAFSTIKKQTDRQTDKVTTVTLSRMRAEG